MSVDSWPWEVLDSLARSRPVFHSEADFQHSFAWHAQLLHPGAQVRLEVRPDPDRRESLDLLCIDEATRIAIEFKYLVRAFDAVVGGERFVLRNQGAQPLSRYDILKDVERLERFCNSGFAHVGYGIVLSNDPLIWSPGRPGSIDEAFRVHDGAAVSGALGWAPHAGPGTTRGRDRTINLTGTYGTTWRPYSRGAMQSATPFKAMVLTVRPQSG